MELSRLHSAVARLAGLADADADAVWRQVSTAAQAREALAEILPAIIDKYGTAAATLAAEWYDQHRASLDIAGGFRAAPVDLGDRGAEALAGWAVTPLFAESPAWDAAKVRLSGGLQRRIADMSRETVMRNSVADPHATGWQRVTDGNGCAFCVMLAGRGAVYSEASADFASHDKCGCGAVPAFDGLPKPVKPYTPSPRNITDADRARVREWIASH